MVWDRHGRREMRAVSPDRHLPTPGPTRLRPEANLTQVHCRSHTQGCLVTGALAERQRNRGGAHLALQRGGGQRAHGHGPSCTLSGPALPSTQPPRCLSRLREAEAAAHATCPPSEEEEDRVTAPDRPQVHRELEDHLWTSLPRRRGIQPREPPREPRQILEAELI